jgi:TatD DNase family protein
MIDSHCHFDFPEFDDDREAVWKRATGNGVDQLLIPGTEFHRFSGIQELCKTHPDYYYALGLHPWFLTEQSPQQLEELSKLIADSVSDNQLVAIGETGLDLAPQILEKVPIALQEECFEFQLQLAQQNKLPVIIHHRRSNNRIIQILKRHPGIRGVIHAFSGSKVEAQTYVDMGFSLGIGGTITYERSQKTRKAIKSVGIEHLLLETDAPAMPLNGRQGQRNSPEFLHEVRSSLAKLMDVSDEIIERVTTDNFMRVFVS